MTDKNTFKKVGIASFIMMASVFASRLIGVFREISIAGIGGIQSGVDAYQIAFVLPEILNHIVASGFLSITFIPIFTGYLTRGKEQEGYKVFSIIHNGFGLFLISLILIAMIRAPQLVHLIAPGITDPDTFAKAVRMTRIILPAQFFFFSGGLLMAIQFSHEKFFIPALAPLIYNIFIIAGGLFLGPFIGMEGFAWGVLVGAVTGNFALQLIGTCKLNIQYSPVINFTHPDLIRYTKLTLPLMLGLTMTFSTELQFKFFGSFLPPGSIAAINYALRITFLIVGLFGQAVGVASYPFMAKLAGSGRLDELNQLLNQTLKYIFLVIPVSVLFIVLSHEIVLILFQRWEFDAQATRITRGILPFFMIGAFAFSAQTIVSRGYYAMQNTLFPTLVVSLCVILSVPLTYFLMLSLGARGVALGLSVSAIIQCLVLFECWSKKSKNAQKKQVYFYLLKLLPISLVIGLILFASAGFLRQIFDSFTFSGAMNIALITGTEFLLIFYAAGRIFKITEIFLLYENTYKRIISWKKKLI
ncbi:MAG: murein biosynthesis integral membrane protein MurJ [Proteobacteria bacterium]|nr:murein biosynthesis integral membrane protein MurJ [Pseudomonadota bacterium]MBU1387293.1 murein biosynthesis integral membrane protein MurJ [Pseudomonadota bacterium]MBU1544275.1 murein biosynthesis integral membrane protein MurJ [Pseudomonadota bacterium]MBU2483000.1 murein biosynthesis integral membrane protein MurJ [Pseudomonadota bacterium]